MINLDDFNNLGALMTSTTTEACQKSKDAFMLDISLIDEDPNQPRTDENPGFSEESINELAQTIKERGVKSPISVREADNGRYIINHGARRYRASKIAGLTMIPGIIDNDYLKLDQVIENIQRNNLTPNEIATFIEEEIKKGKKKNEVATELGKSNAWVSQYYALLTLPDDIDFCWQSGVFGDDVTVVSEVAKLYKRNPNVVMDFLHQEKKLGRKDAARLKEMMERNDFSDTENVETVVEENISKNREDENADNYYVEDNQIYKIEKTEDNILEHNISNEEELIIDNEDNIEKNTVTQSDEFEDVAQKMKTAFNILIDLDIEKIKNCIYLSEEEKKVAEMCKELISELKI